MATIDFPLWGKEPPHRGQAPVWRKRDELWDRGLTAFLACGPRWGKDRLSVWLNLYGLLRLYQERQASAHIPPVLSWVVGPVQSDFKQVFREYEVHTQGLPRKVQKAAGNETIVLFPGPNLEANRGIWIEFKSGWQEDRLVGAGIDSAHITEGAKLPTAAYEILLTRLASPGRAGVQIINGTPTTTPSGWYVDMFRRGASGTDPSLLFVNEPTWKNPTLTYRNLRELVRQRQRTSTRSWLANQAAQLVPEGSGIFAGLTGASRLKPLTRGEPGVHYVKFYDPAGTGMDHHVLTAFSTDGKQVSIKRWLRDSLERTEARIRSFCLDFPGEIHVDETGQTPSSLVQRLKRDCIPAGEIVRSVTITNALKMAWVDYAAAEIEHGRVKLLHKDSCPEAMVQFGEMSDFQEKRTASGGVKYEAPEGMHDDTVIAAIGAIYALKRNQGMDVGKTLGEIGAL